MYKLLNYVFLFLMSLSYLQAEEIVLKISLKNGTTGGIGKADTIKLIALQGGMTPIGEFQNKQGDFTLEKINFPDQTPVLIQVSYKGANYNKMVPPTPVFRSKVQEITVYELTSELKDIEVRSLMQIIREENLLRVYKIFLIENKTNPPRSFQNTTTPIEIFVPSEAGEIFGQLTQGDSKMGIPLNLRDGAKGKIVDRPILPGTSELQIAYTIPAESLADVSFKDEFSFEDKNSPRIIFFKPKDMKIEIKGSIEQKDIKEEIPQGLGAIRASYPNSKSVEVAVSGGKPEVEEMTQGSQNRKVRNGTIFTTWDKSLLGVIGILGLLGTLSLVFVYRK